MKEKEDLKKQFEKEKNTLKGGWAGYLVAAVFITLIIAVGVSILIYKFYFKF